MWASGRETVINRRPPRCPVPDSPPDPRSRTATNRSSPARLTARTLISIIAHQPGATMTGAKAVQPMCTFPYHQHEPRAPNCQAFW
jgi:hypothetical protein